jgi:uncharacterized protein
MNEENRVPQRREYRAIVAFVVLACTISWLLWGFVWLSGVGRLRGVGILLVALGMWGPGLSALIVTRVVLRESLRTTTIGRLGRKRYYVWAWLLPAAGTAITILLTIAFGVAAIKPEDQLFEGVLASQGALPPIPPWCLVAIMTLGGILIAPLVNAPFALGEEIGWRGFLLPRLMKSGLSQWPALVLSSAIWGLWHAPIIAQGHNYPEHPYLGIAIMTVACTLAGIIQGWLQLASGSVWAPTAFHGALNGIAGLPLLILTPHDSALGGTPLSVIGWIPATAFVAWLALSRRLPVATVDGVLCDRATSPPG